MDEGKKSIAFSLTFEDYSKTLTDEEVNLLFQQVIEKTTTQVQATLRDHE